MVIWYRSPGKLIQESTKKWSERKAEETTVSANPNRVKTLGGLENLAVSGLQTRYVVDWRKGCQSDNSEITVDLERSFSHQGTMAAIALH